MRDHPRSLQGRSPIAEDPQTPVPIAAAPPTKSRPFPPLPEPWPTTIGTISVVLGSFGGIVNARGLAQTLTQSAVTGVSTGTIDATDAMQQYRPWLALSSAIAVLLSILLLTAGFGLTRRRAWSLKALRAWALAQLLFVPAAGVFAYVYFMQQQAQYQAMHQRPMFTFASPGVVAGIFLVIGLVWGCTWPAFTLHWLRRPTIRAQTSDWR